MKIMKLQAYAFGLSIISLLSFTGCNKNSEIQKIRQEYAAKMDSLQSVNNNLNEFIDVIAYSIDTISTQEGMFLNVVNTESGVPSNKEKINKELSYLHSLIQEQKAKISELEKKQKNSDSEHSRKIQKIIKAYEQQLAEKETRIAELEAQINRKEMDIASLTNNLTSLQGKVDEAEEIINSQTEVIENQDALINEGYVIVGTKKELQQMDILTSSGLFKKAKLNLSNINTDKFDKVDIR